MYRIHYEANHITFLFFECTKGLLTEVEISNDLIVHVSPYTDFFSEKAKEKDDKALEPPPETQLAGSTN